MLSSLSTVLVMAAGEPNRILMAPLNYRFLIFVDRGAVKNEEFITTKCLCYLLVAFV